MQAKIITDNANIVEHFRRFKMWLSEDCNFDAVCSKKALTSLLKVFLLSVNFAYPAITFRHRKVSFAQLGHSYGETFLQTFECDAIVLLGVIHNSNVVQDTGDA